MNNIDIERLEIIMELAVKHKFDVVEFDGIKLVKTKHDYPQTKPNEPSKDELEDLLYYSANQ